MGAKKTKETTNNELWNAIIGIVIVALITIFAIVIFSGNDAGNDAGSRKSQQTSQKWSEDDIEYKLAVIENDGFVDYDDPRIDEYAVVLKRTEPRCKEDKQGVSDISVKGMQLLAEDGITVTPYDMIEAIGESIPKGQKKPVRCSEILGTVILLMKNR